MGLYGPLWAYGQRYHQRRPKAVEGRACVFMRLIRPGRTLTAGSRMGGEAFRETLEGDLASGAVTDERPEG